MTHDTPDADATTDSDAVQNDADIDAGESSASERDAGESGAGDTTDAHERQRRRTGDDDRTGAAEATATAGTRRDVLRASVAAGALALVGSTSGSARTLVEEDCERGATFTVGDGDFTVLNNQWSNQSATQCIQRYDDGSYGWRFQGGSGDINYPEVFVGARPWGSNTGVAEFPLPRGDVDELTMAWNFEIDVQAGQEWNLTEEWWLMEGQPGSDPALTHEIMLVLDWSDQHSHGGDRETNLWTDRFGNQIDYWAFYPSGGTSADFHIFKIHGGAATGQVDLARILEFMDQRHGLADDLTLTGIELGTETFDGPTGDVVANQFDVTINGSTYTSGPGDSGGGGGDVTAPTAPSNLSATAASSSAIDASWSASSDSGGSGLAHYAVHLDGVQDQTVPAGTTSTTVTGLSADTSYSIGVSAVDGAGNESATATASATTDADSGDGGSGDVFAELNPSTTSGAVGERITFQVQDTTGSDHWLTELDWTFGDGTTGTGWWNAHSYASAGSYTVALTATTNTGEQSTDEVTITVA